MTETLQAAFALLSINCLRPFTPQARAKGLGRCVEWTGARNNAGYGVLNWGGRVVLAHRLAYETFTGQVLDSSLTIDHLCHNRACLKPSHMEEVSREENGRRGALIKAPVKVCKNGHPIESGVPCRPCARQRNAEYRARKARQA